ncbi:MAG: crossover junction endodeoxyribonuclease RuvC [Parcubacteria group bacterium]|nr:crossover junction endodeoxyribonuclease RuvC [Parcubacteria group bacterium]
MNRDTRYKLHDIRVLAIDPGFERLGIAVIEKKQKGREILLFSSCFRTSPKLPFPERLESVGKEIEKMIKKFKPRALAIETLFFNTNQRTAMRVAEARGAIMFVSKKMGLEIFEYSPLQIKIAITGYGRATKEQITLMIPRLIDIKNKGGKTDDEYDAIAVGLTHCASTLPVDK